MRWVRLLVASLLVVGCTETSSPASTPTTVATTSSTTTSMTLATTTTVDRLAEIEAIFRDLEERRLDALYRGDRQAFAALFANDAYLEESLGAFEVVEFVAPPSVIAVHVREVLRDEGACLAVRYHLDESQALGEEAVGEVLDVLQRTSNGDWGFAYSGDGWLCEGPHPLSS